VETYPQAVKTPNSQGQLPLHLACSQRNHLLQVLELLVDKYPQSVAVNDLNGRSALQLYYRTEHTIVPDVLRLLLAKTIILDGTLSIENLQRPFESITTTEPFEDVMTELGNHVKYADLKDIGFGCEGSGSAFRNGLAALTKLESLRLVNVRLPIEDGTSSFLCKNGDLDGLLERNKNLVTLDLAYIGSGLSMKGAKALFVHSSGQNSRRSSWISH